MYLPVKTFWIIGLATDIRPIPPAQVPSSPNWWNITGLPTEHYFKINLGIESLEY
jgi:hypothetical protein